MHLIRFKLLHGSNSKTEPSHKITISIYETESKRKKPLKWLELQSTIVIRMKTLWIIQSIYWEKRKKLQKLLFKNLTSNIHNNSSLYRKNHVLKRFNCLRLFRSARTFKIQIRYGFNSFKKQKHMQTHTTPHPH